MDAVSFLMFAIPFIVSLCFSFGALFSNPTKDDPTNLAGIFFSLGAWLFWWVFGLIWAGSATMEMYVSVAWAWYGFGLAFMLILFYRVFQALQTSVLAPSERLSIRENTQEE